MLTRTVFSVWLTTMTLILITSSEVTKPQIRQFPHRNYTINNIDIEKQLKLNFTCYAYYDQNEVELDGSWISSLSPNQRIVETEDFIVEHTQSQVYEGVKKIYLIILVTEKVKDTSWTCAVYYSPINEPFGRREVRGRPIYVLYQRSHNNIKQPKRLSSVWKAVIATSIFLGITISGVCISLIFLRKRVEKSGADAHKYQSHVMDTLRKKMVKYRQSRTRTMKSLNLSAITGSQNYLDYPHRFGPLIPSNGVYVGNNINVPTGTAAIMNTCVPLPHQVFNSLNANLTETSGMDNLNTSTKKSITLNRNAQIPKQSLGTQQGGENREKRPSIPVATITAGSPRKHSGHAFYHELGAVGSHNYSVLPSSKKHRRKSSKQKGKRRSHKRSELENR